MSHRLKNNPTIHIYQPYLTEADKLDFDPAFMSFDWRHNPSPEYREIGLFFDFLESGRYQCADYTGVFSKRFFIKTKIPGEQFIQFIRDNPGYDVYFINPFPQHRYYSFNSWDQGEFFHPGIIKVAQSLFDCAGLPIDIANLGRQKGDTLLYCNYWVGNARFWDSYVSFLKKLCQCILNNFSKEKQQMYFEDTPYFDVIFEKVYQCPLFPFIFERLFSTYIEHQADFTYLAYQHNEEEITKACINSDELRTYVAFRELVDAWDSVGRADDDVRHILNTLFGLTWDRANRHLNRAAPSWRATA